MCPQTHWPMLHYTTPLHHALLQPVKLSRIRAPSKRLRFVHRPPRDGDVGRMEGEDVLFRQWNEPGAEFLTFAAWLGCYGVEATASLQSRVLAG